MLGLNFDPLITCGLVGFVWPLIQAALDKPYWTSARRRVLVLVAGLVLSLVVWWAGAYPMSWQLIASQASVVIAAAATAFTVLKSIGVIDWVGRATPGGEPYEAKHKSGGDGR